MLFGINMIFQENHAFLPTPIKYVCTSTEGSMIRELCLQRDNDAFI